MERNKFIFATGIENSYPTIRLQDGSPFRVDEMRKAGHYKQWKDDFRLKEMGIEFLRYRPPYFSTHLGPEQCNWSFTDETFAQLQAHAVFHATKCSW